MFLNAKSIEQHLIFDEEARQLGKPAQVGFDLSISHINRIIGGTHKLTQSGSEIDMNAYLPMPWIVSPYRPKERVWELYEGVYAIAFHQGCSLPDNVKAEIVHRSSLLRMGVEIKSAVYDPGFKTERMGAVMIVHNNVSIEYGSRVAQIIMAYTETSEKYDGQYQGEKDVK